MYAKDFAGYDRGDREGIESVDKGFPDLDVGSAFALVVKAIDYKIGLAYTSPMSQVVITYLWSRLHTHGSHEARRNFPET